MQNTTETYIAAVVGYGTAVHKLRSAQTVGARLTTSSIRCGAGRSRRAGVVGGPATIRLTSEEVTCKRCIKIAESDAIWAGNAAAPTKEAEESTGTITTTQIAAQIAQAREHMQVLINNDVFSAATRERQERRINQLKAKLANA